MSIYQEIENVIAPIFNGLREDVKSWLVPTISIIMILGLAIAMTYLLLKVLFSLIKAPEKSQPIISDNEDNNKKIKKKYKRFY